MRFNILSVYTTVCSKDQPQFNFFKSPSIKIAFECKFHKKSFSWTSRLWKKKLFIRIVLNKSNGLNKRFNFCQFLHIVFKFIVFCYIWCLRCEQIGRLQGQENYNFYFVLEFFFAKFLKYFKERRNNCTYFLMISILEVKKSVSKKEILKTNIK